MILAEMQKPRRSTEDGWVLVVDDNESVRESTADILGAAGFKVKKVRDAEEAEGILSHGEVSVVVLDVGIDRRGLAVLDVVADLPPVVLVSGGQDPGDPRAAVFLPKPVPPQRLIEEVARHALRPDH